MRASTHFVLMFAIVVAGCDGDPATPDGGADKRHPDAGGGRDAGSDAGAHDIDAGAHDVDAGGADAGAGSMDADAAATDAGADDKDAGDGSSDSDAGDARGKEEVATCDGPLLPMAVGNKWTYRVTHPVDGVSMKTTVVDKKERVGGTGPNADKKAFHVVTTKTTDALTDTTESWQAVLANDSVVRYRELAFKDGSTTPNGEEFWEPYKLRVDESPKHLALDATWQEKYTETKIKGDVETPAERNDGWVVDGVDVPCGPVHGKMLSCIKISKTADGAAAGKTYLYARCVGKVREEGSQTEELTDYKLK